MVSGYPTSTSLPRVDGLSTDPRVFGCHSGKGMHRLHDMHVVFSLCQHEGMSKACACGCKVMGAIPWLGCLGKSSNKALSGAGHGLGARHVTKASLT